MKNGQRGKRLLAEGSTEYRTETQTAPAVNTASAMSVDFIRIPLFKVNSMLTDTAEVADSCIGAQLSLLRTNRRNRVGKE